jgi:hypothetical protein
MQASFCIVCVYVYFGVGTDDSKRSGKVEGESSIRRSSEYLPEGTGTGKTAKMSGVWMGWLLWTMLVG